MPTRPPTMRPVGRPARQVEARPSPSCRGYGRPWQRTRAAKLAADPYCQHCRERGELVPAEEVDHITAITAGGTDDLSNLQSLCKPCHSRKTCAVDGGLGHTARDSSGRPTPDP